MLYSGALRALAVEWPGPVDGASPPPPKLGSVTVVDPPCTDTPGMAGAPFVPKPGPPEPRTGEIPPWALGSAPRPGPSLPPPEPSPWSPLPGPFPFPMLVPPPLPATPAFPAPPGDMAIAPALEELGNPSVVPGLLEMTTPLPAVFPPAFAGGATDEPRSSGPPAPAPLLPRPLPERALPPPKPGGGGTTSAEPRSVPPS